MTQLYIRATSWFHETTESLREDDGFQTAEAIGIAAVGLLVLFAVLTVLRILGVDVVDWFRSAFGVPEGGSTPATP